MELILISVQNWRTLYINSGIEDLMIHQKSGFKYAVRNVKVKRKILHVILLKYAL